MEIMEKEFVKDPEASQKNAAKREKVNVENLKKIWGKKKKDNI
jgi:hypothetical protein